MFFLNLSYAILLMHPIEFEIFRVFVRLGELDSSRANLCDNNRDLCTEPQDYEIESIVHHPNYDMPKYANDVALIRLRQTTNSSMHRQFRF